MLRMTRAAILNVMETPYIETAELKVLSRWRTIVRHAAPNAVAPIINVVALNLAFSWSASWCWSWSSFTPASAITWWTP